MQLSMLRRIQQVYDALQCIEKNAGPQCSIASSEEFSRSTMHYSILRRMHVEKNLAGLQCSRQSLRRMQVSNAVEQVEKNRVGTRNITAD